MKQPRQTHSDTRTLGRAMRDAGTHAHKTGELAMASGTVVARRMALGAAAMMDPFNADHGEFAKMIPEKTTAFLQSGMSWLQWSSKIAEQMASFAATEMATAAKATVEIASCSTPADSIALQSSFATAWFARAISQSITLGSLAMRSQIAAMSPVHRTAKANARRLSR